MNKKLFLVMVLVVGAVIGLWTWTFLAPNNSISIGGSASVQPLLKKLTSNYKTEDNKSFVYSATGSGAGVTNVKKDVYEIGFISKKVKPADWEENNVPVDENSNLFAKDNVKPWSEENNDWYWNQLTKEQKAEEESYRSIELAKDSIVFVYNTKGTGMQEFLDQSNLTFEFELDENNKVSYESSKILQNIYEHDNQSRLWTWQDLALSIAETQSTPENRGANVSLAYRLVKPSKITPYTSTSGSGTRSSFTDLTQLKDENRGVKPGQAAKEYNSNGAIYNQVINSPGSIGFVSMLYGEHASGNTKTVNIKQGEKVWDLNDPMTSRQDYPLTRPFIAIFKYKIHEKDSPEERHLKTIVEFVYWMATSEAASKAYEDLGLQQSVK